MNDYKIFRKFKKTVLCALTMIIFFIVLSIIMVGFDKDINKNTIKGVSNFYLDDDKIVLKNKDNDNDVKVKVYITKDKKIEEMNLEEYIKGVVASEMPVSFGIEALKAQAVAARTFALAHLESFNGKKCKEANGGDICDTVHCQVYTDKNEIINSWEEKNREEYWNKVCKAVNDTSGEILCYNGMLVMEPYYFSVSSGRTENALEVFSDNAPYLKSVESPGEDIAPKYKAIKTFTYKEFENAVNNCYAKANLNIKNLKNQINIINRNEGGSVREVKLGNVTITGVQFRSLLNLNSSNFTFKFKQDTIEITTIGYGHGVGMSQWGANAMAKSGKKYDEILYHYYQGVKIEKIKK